MTRWKFSSLHFMFWVLGESVLCQRKFCVLSCPCQENIHIHMVLLMLVEMMMGIRMSVTYTTSTSRQGQEGTLHAMNCHELTTYPKRKTFLFFQSHESETVGFDDDILIVYLSTDVVILLKEGKRIWRWWRVVFWQERWQSNVWCTHW